MKLSKNKKILLILIVVIVILVILKIQTTNKTNQAGTVTESVTEGIVWKTYTNTQYGFKVSFPSDWKIFEDFSQTSPIINIYKPDFDTKPPLNQFSDANAVSIFPRGVETEALIGEIVESNIKIKADTDKAVDYLLDNGEIWATYVTFKTVPESWKPWGSVWLVTKIKNLDFSCRSNNQIIEVENCDPFAGDTFIRIGQTDKEIWATEVKILGSFEFLEE